MKIILTCILSIGLFLYCGEPGENKKDAPDNLICTGDGNDTINCATNLEEDKRIDSMLSNNTDIDYYKIQIEDIEGDYIFFTYDKGVDICSVDTTLILFDSDEKTVLATNNEASTTIPLVPDPCSAIKYRFGLKGIYYLKVASNATGSPRQGDYSINVNFIADYIHYPGGILSHWKADETSGDLVDHLGNQSLTNKGEIGSVSGFRGNSRGPFTSSKYFYSTDSIFDSQYFLVEFWINTTNTYVYQGIIGNFNDGNSYDGSRGWGFFIDDYQKELAYFLGDFPRTRIHYTSATLFNGEWHYIVLAKIKTDNIIKSRLYIDGQHRAEADGETDQFNTSTGLKIGTQMDNIYRPYKGKIDDIVYWNTPPRNWSDVDEIVTNRWNNGKPKYYR